MMKVLKVNLDIIKFIKVNSNNYCRRFNKFMFILVSHINK